MAAVREGHPTHRFKPGIEFDLVLQHYIFDRKLRLLVMDAIERIEVSLRTRWAYHLAHSYRPHALLRPDLFKERWSHAENINSLKDIVHSSSEVFIRHFDRYDEALPPVWVTCEIMTLGQLSKWYANLRSSKDRNTVARGYGLDETNLTSFLHHLTVVRNHCAHHARIWNREFTFLWKLPRRTPRTLHQNFDQHDARKIYNTLVMLAYLVETMGPNSWKKRLNSLFIQHPQVSASSMGFPHNWRTMPIWRDIETSNIG